MSAPRYGRVNLSMAAIAAVAEVPQRIPLNGQALLRPRLASGAGEVGRGPAGEEIQIPLPVQAQVIEGVLTQGGLPHVTLLVPTDAWYWDITFSGFSADDTPVLLDSFSFPVVEATAEQLADDAFAGTNIAPFAAVGWQPGAQIPPAGDKMVAEMRVSLDRALAAGARVETEHGHVHEDVQLVDAMVAQVMAALQAANVFAHDQVPPYLQPGQLDDKYGYPPGLDVRKFGATVGSTADMAPALNAAAAAARAAKVPLYIPEGRMYIDSTVDLRYLNIVSMAEIVVRHTNAPGVIIGDTSVQRNARQIYVRWVRHESVPLAQWDWPNPAIQVRGLKGAYVNVGNCSLMELFADANVSTDTSIAYNTFALGRVNHLRLHGINGSGWVNQNLFLGGSYARITLSGTYGHNNNKWVMPSVEGSTSLIDLQRGSQNVFEDARGEGGASVKFGAATWRNTVSVLFTSNPSLLDYFAIIEDLGDQNIVTSRDLLQMTPQVVFKIDSTTPLFDTAGAGVSSDPTGPSLPIPAVGTGKLAIRSTNKYFIDTGMMKIREDASGGSNRTVDPFTRIKRLLLNSDQTIMRPQIFGYDSNGVQIDANVTPFLDTYAGLSANATSGAYTFSAAVASAVMTINNPSVKYLRVRVMSSVSGNPLFSHVTLTAYVESAVNGHVVESMRRQALGSGGLYSPTKPTQGVATPGTIVAGPTDSWKATARVDTALTAEATGTALTVASGTGIAAGDVIGVLLASGRTHWSSVSTVSGTTVTIATAVPTPAPVGATVSTTRWAVL